MKKNASKKLIAALIMVAAIMFAAVPGVLADGTTYGPGRIGLKILEGRDHVEAGSGGIWNSRDKLHIQLDPADGWRIKGYHVDLGGGEDYLPPLTITGNPMIGHFEYRDDFALPYVNEANEDGHPFRRTLALDLVEDLGFQWGAPFADLRTQGVAIFLSLVMLDDTGHVIKESGAWVVPDLITWVVSEEDGGSEVVVGDDATVADASTGQLVDTEATEVKQTVKGTVAAAEHQEAQRSWEVEEAEEIIAFDGGRWGWWFSYEMAHPRTGHFIDSPVAGLHVETPTYEGVTDETAAFDYFPGEKVDISIGSVFLGSAVADRKVSPLDIFPASDTDDTKVINMGRLLQSLDVDSEPQGGISISEEVVGAFEQAMALQGLATIDFADDAQVEAVIQDTINAAALLEPAILLTAVSAVDAKAHLDDTLNNIMFRKNVSKTPDQASTKAKMALSTMWFPALPASAVDGTEVKTLEYKDEAGNLIRTMETAHPLVVTYTDDDPLTHAADVWGAVSLDDGETFKRVNLSRSGDISSFTLANGDVYYGKCKKPVVQFRGNRIMVAWSSKYAKGGKPRYAIDPEDDYTSDDAYYAEDIWGISGPQRSYDYTPDGFPEVGEVPHSALWINRGIICTQTDITGTSTIPAIEACKYVGDIVWFKPERLTSGRRDVNQIFLAGASGSGFGVIWQEDPNGVRPGRAVGPGPGWGGATTSHKTDIWYSFLPWGDVTKVDVNFEAGGDPEHDLDVASRPKALVPWSLPIRLSDNDVVNTNNILVETDETTGIPVLDATGNFIPLANEDALAEEGDGTHRYATEIPGLISDWYTFTNYNNEVVTVAVTEDGRLLDGDTGASRPNLFLQTYEFMKPDGTMGKSAWTIITYEETKGAGAGPPEEGSDPSDAYLPEEGKNIIYHSFDFKNPDLVSGGGIVNSPEFLVGDDNLPVLDGNGYITPLYLVDENGGQILDYLGRPQLAYQNARRGRFLPQGVGAIVLKDNPKTPVVEVASRTALLMVYKEGPDGAGRPSDIMLRRWLVPDDVNTFVGTLTQPVPHNPYQFANINSDWVVDEASGQGYFAILPQNMSSVTPTITSDSSAVPNEEANADDPYGAVKVVEWEQTVDNLADPSFLNGYDDARAHRGAIRFDNVTVGFSYTPNWAAARNGNDKYDFYIRRSYDGGATWSTDPKGSGTEHCITWTDPDSKEKTDECFTAAAGEFERMRNLSQLPNATSSVIEPRIVAVPGTIKDPATGLWTGIPEDKQNAKVFYVAYGTSTNPKKDPVTGEQEEPAPQDLFWSVTKDFGENYLEDEWVVNPDSDGDLAGETVRGWDWMAKGDQEQGEVQLRMTPDGTKFYGSWLDEGDEGSDISFRRILTPYFDVNIGTENSTTVATSELTETDVDAASSDDFSSNSGGDND